jgi:hypothetical protein
VFVAVALALPMPVAAQQLPQLRITAFSLRSDAASPSASVPFHLVVSIRVRESVASLDGVVLPMLGPLEILGDEKRITASSSGTQYREILTVVAHAPGVVTIGSAYLDAIDARDGKPKRFLSNSVTVDITGASASDDAARARVLRDGAWFASLLAGIAGVVVLAWAVLARRSQVPIVPPPAPEPVRSSQPAEPQDVYERVRADLDADPTRAAARRGRERLWAAVGASEFETLADVLRRPAAHDAAVRAVLRALERAAFTHDENLPDAIRDAIVALEKKERS